MDNILEVKNLIKSYGNSAALNGISFTIPKGKIVGVLGPNGSGKTTLIKLIMSLLSGHNGEILIKGLPPGPIANPGREALKAALYPESGKWLFWCVVDPSTGETDFNNDLKGHNASVKKYQDWCKQSDDNYRICFGKDR